MGAEHPNIAPYGKLYQCADKVSILLAVGNDHQFKNLCNVLGLKYDSLKTEYGSNSARVKNREALNQLLSEAISQQASKELPDSLHQAKVPAGRLNDMQEVFASELAQSLVLKDANGKPTGLRNFIAATTFPSKVSHIAPPPAFD